ncbi:MAG TPA: class I SAM-dependent methyltransferase [Candidatus Acidoferrales bacterium]|nr:class I SAM-dependent methyltransferase [Candidatus Acidoferrales bacterium]
MNSFENWFCASGLWRYLTERRWLPWALDGTNLGEDVLEVGAGPGAATAELARRMRSVTSLEYSHDFCVKLRAKVDAARVVQGDASVLPFESQTFSSAIAVLVLHHLRSRDAQDRAFAEIFRVLKSGGVFVAIEIQDGWLTRVTHFRSTFVPVSTDGLDSRLRAAGFSNVSVNNRSGAIRIRAERIGANGAQEKMAR